MFDNQITNTIPAAEPMWDADTSNTTSATGIKDGLFLAENLMDLYVKKQKLGH